MQRYWKRSLPRVREYLCRERGKIRLDMSKKVGGKGGGSILHGVEADVTWEEERGAADVVQVVTFSPLSALR
jgi:hypothetical protein